MEAVWSYIAKASNLPPAELVRTIARISPTARISFMSTYDQIVKKAKAEGNAEGKAAGRAEGKTAVLLRQLRIRFGPLPASAVARIRRASSVQLDRWAGRLLNAQTLAGVFGSGRQRAIAMRARRSAANR